MNALKTLAGCLMLAIAAGCSDCPDQDPAIDSDTAWYAATLAAAAWSRAGVSVSVRQEGDLVSVILPESDAELRMVAGPLRCGDVAPSIACASGLIMRIAASELSGLSPDQRDTALPWVAAHEIGHLLGYEHEDPRVPLMSLRIGGSLAFVPELSSVADQF